LEYKKPATKFPAILDGIFTEVHAGSTVSGKPHHGWWGRQEGKDKLEIKWIGVE